MADVRPPHGTDMADKAQASTKKTYIVPSLISLDSLKATEGKGSTSVFEFPPFTATS